MIWLINGDVAEHLRKPRCRIKFKHTDRPPDDWHAELVEWMGEDDPPVDNPMLFAGLFAEAKTALEEHRKGKA